MNVWGLLLFQMELDEEHRFVSISISLSEMKLYNITLDDISGLVSMMNRATEQDLLFCLLRLSRAR